MRSSIIIPTYNQKPEYLLAAVNSALLQTAAVQVIVVDDGSDEPVEPFLHKMLGAQFAFVHVVRKDNGGVADALNTGIRYVDTKYVQWLSSDDVFMAEKTRLQADLMEKTGAMVSYCAYEEGLPQPYATWCAAQYPSKEALFGVLKQHCFINACTVMWHEDVFGEIGMFDLEMHHCQDYEFLLRCAERYEFQALNIPLVRRRVHQGQMIHTLKQESEAAHKANELDYLKERYGATAQVWVPR